MGVYVIKLLALGSLPLNNQLNKTNQKQPMSAALKHPI